MAEATGRADTPSVPKDLNDLVLDLSVAVHKHAMYPLGHPALARVAEGVVHRAARLFATREQIAIGVARRQLIVEGTPTDEANPVLRRLAENLHAHQLGAVTLVRGLGAGELAEALRALSVEPEHGGPIGLQPPDVRHKWPHIGLHPLTFDNLSIVTPTDEQAAPGSVGADLWLGLAQAALAGDSHTTDAPTHGASTEEIARAIDQRDGAHAYDQVIAGYLMQITQALRSATGAEAEALRAKTSGLVAMLQPSTLRRLVRTSRSGSGSQEFVRDAVRGLRVDAVLEILKATADVSGETISHGLVRMLTKLAAHAAAGAVRVRSDAEEALRGQVSRLLEDWKLADPNPESYSRLLQQLATSEQDDADALAETIEDPSLRLVQMGLELGGLGVLGTRAAARQIDAGHIGAVIALLDAPPPAAGPAADELRMQLRTPGALARLLSEEPVDFPALDSLLPSMTVAEHEPLLDALAESHNRMTRRRLIDRLAQSKLDLSAPIADRLSDPRWHVVRNMLLLLERRRQVPPGFSTVPYLQHDDWRVRYEAVRLALTLPDDAEPALQMALAERQPRIIAVGLSALPGECPPALVEQVTQLAADATLPEDTRVLALRVLEDAAQPECLSTLTALVDGGRTLFGRVKLAAASPISLGALRVLARHFGDDPAAAPFLKLARASSSADVVAAASGVSS